MKRYLTLLLAILIAGCVPSWNPFYTEKDLVFNSALVGTWRPAESKDGSKEAWGFTKIGDQRYQLQQTDEDGRKAEFEARLFKLKDRQFLDLYLTKIDRDDFRVNAVAGVALVPAHLLLKVEQIEPTLKLAVMNPEWIRDHLKQHPEALAHRVVAEQDIVLSASTSQLQAFVRAHGDDKDFFGGPMVLKRK